MSKATITIEAFVANDLTVREAGSHRVVDVSLPHTPRKKEGDQWVDAGPTTWFQASFWDEHADAVLVAVEKGSLVTVTGFPELETYQKNDGTAGGKVLVKFPTLAVVVRKGQQSSRDSLQAPVESGDVWDTSGSYSDEQPF